MCINRVKRILKVFEILLATYCFKVIIIYIYIVSIDIEICEYI